MRRPTPDPVSPGQESVWDYPRPSVAQAVDAHLVIILAGRTIAETRRGVRTIETSHPPTYYFPRADVAANVLRQVPSSSLCEWKGSAIYFDVVVGDQLWLRSAWAYPQPTAPFAIIRDHIAFYAAAMDACFVDGEQVRPQPGDFYGGWITSRVSGPFKGVPGSQGW